MTNDPIEEFLVQLETETSITKIVECQQLLALVRIYRGAINVYGGFEKLLEDGYTEITIKYYGKPIARTAEQKALEIVK